MPTDIPRPEQTRILAMANQKGGVGKTTTTVNLGASLAAHNASVLIIDLDPQGNASTALGIDHHSEEIPSIYDVLVEEEPLDKVTLQTAFSSNLHCVPSTLDLAGAEVELFQMMNRENRLKNAISASSKRFDYVLLDCPPSLGLLTVNALAAAKEVFVPLQTEYYALEGMSQLMRTIEIVRKQLNPDLHISTVLLTMYDARTRLSDQVADEVRAVFPSQTLATKIPRSVRAAEAPSHGKTLIEYDPPSPATLAYHEAARELARRGAQ